MHVWNHDTWITNITKSVYFEIGRGKVLYRRKKQTDACVESNGLV